MNPTYYMVSSEFIGIEKYQTIFISFSIYNSIALVLSESKVYLWFTYLIIDFKNFFHSSYFCGCSEYHDPPVMIPIISLWLLWRQEKALIII